MIVKNYLYFLSSDVWAQFSQKHSYMQFKTRHPARDVDLQNELSWSLKEGVSL